MAGCNCGSFSTTCQDDDDCPSGYYCGPSKVCTRADDGGPGDAASADATIADASPGDSTIADRATADAPHTDAAVADTSVADTSIADTNIADATVADTSVADTSVADAGHRDAAAPDTLAADSGATDNAPCDCAAGPDAIADRPLFDAGGCLGFNYYRPVMISNPGSALADYQVRVVVNTADLIEQTYLNEYCEDIRFLDSDLSTLSHWLESGCKTPTTVFWVRVPEIPAGEKCIYLIYGNQNAASASNGPGTFLLFEDFAGTVLDTNKWEPRYAGNGVNVLVANEELEIAGTPAAGDIYEAFGVNTRVYFQAPYAIHSSFKIVAQELASSRRSNIFIGGQITCAGSTVWDGVAIIGTGSTTNTHVIGCWDPVQEDYHVLGDSSLDAQTYGFKKLVYAMDLDGVVRVWENGIPQHTTVDHYNTVQRKLVFRYGPNQTEAFDVRFDDIFVANFAFPEPTASVGAEHHCATPGG